MSSTAEGPGMPPDPSLVDVGILFIHGIGSQQRGETLLNFGEPIYDALQLWAERNHRRVGARVTLQGLANWYDRIAAEWRSKGEDDRVLGRFETIRALLEFTGPSKKVVGPDTVGWEGPVTIGVALGTARIRDESNDDVPSHARLNMKWIETSGVVHERSWLLAESWWAERFYPPRYRDLVRWGLDGLCWTVGSHFSARVRRTWYQLRYASSAFSKLGAVVPFLSSLVYLLLGFLISAGALLVLLVVLLLALLPSRRLRAAVAGLQQRLAASVGDSYMLLASPLTAASIVSHVQRDCDWLSASCRSLVIIAHSQGGAIAHLLLRQGVPDRLKLLVTFGSGLRKLEELRQVQKPDAVKQAWMATAGILVTLVTAPALLFGWSQSRGSLIAALVWSVSAVLGSIVLMMNGHASPELKWWTSVFESFGVKWLDFYASADPVPNGPLWDEADSKDLIPKSEAVHNDASMLGDHTAYWSNRDEFVSKVVTGIAATVDPILAKLFDRDKLDRAIAYERRQWRVAWLSAARKVWFASGVLLVGARVESWKVLLSASGLSNLASYGAFSVRDRLIDWGHNGTVAWLASHRPAWLLPTSPKCESIIDFINSAGPAPSQNCVPIAAFVTAAGPVILLAVTWLVMRGLWRLWEWKDREAFRRASDYDHFALASTFFVLMLTVVPLFAVAQVLRPILDRLRPGGLIILSILIAAIELGILTWAYAGWRRRRMAAVATTAQSNSVSPA